MIPGCFSPLLVFVQNQHGETMVIQQLANDGCHKLLGCYKCPTATSLTNTRSFNINVVTMHESSPAATYPDIKA